MMEWILPFVSILIYLQDFVDMEYCRSDQIPSISFCQNGYLAGERVIYLNGSTITTRDEMNCVCHVSQTTNVGLLVYGDGCYKCGVDITFGDQILSPKSPDYRFGPAVVTLQSVDIRMKTDPKQERFNGEICLVIIGNGGQNVNLTITCDTNTETSTTSLTSVTPVPPTTNIRNSDSTQQDTMVPNNTSVTIGSDNYTESATISERPTEDTLSKVIIPAAAGGGAGVLLVVIIIIVVCCLRKKGNNCPQNEHDNSGTVMTDNPIYETGVAAPAKLAVHTKAHGIGDVYAAVNKGGNSSAPSSVIPHIKADQTGDVYAVVDKGNQKAIENGGDSRGNFDISGVQKSKHDNVTFSSAPSVDYADIDITGPRRPEIQMSSNSDYAEVSCAGEN